MRRSALSCLTVLLFSFANGQIVSGNEQVVSSNESKQKKEKPVKEALDLPENSFYVSSVLGQSFRNLRSADGLFGKPLGERANEVPAFGAGADVGVIGRLNADLRWHAGIGWLMLSEAYRFQGQDTSASYTTRYSYLTLPLGVSVALGKRKSFGFGAGIQAQFLLSYNRNSRFTDSGGVETTSKVDVLEDATSFHLMPYVNVYYAVPIGTQHRLLFQPEFRCQLTNTYGIQGPYVHKPWMFGLRLCFESALN